MQSSRLANQLASCNEQLTENALSQGYDVMDVSIHLSAAKLHVGCEFRTHLNSKCCRLRNMA